MNNNLIDKQIIIQIFGTLMSNPSLLSESDKYNIVPEDFGTSFEKYIFASIYNLFVNGADHITPQDIDVYLKDKSTYHAIFEKEQGILFLQDCIDLAEPENFDIYYTKFRKLKLIEDLKRMGYPTEKLYCEGLNGLMNPDASKINEQFEKRSLRDLLDIIQKDISILEDKYKVNQENKSYKVSNGIKNLIKDFEKSPDVGNKLQGKIYNTIVRGARKGKYYIDSYGTGVGKALPDYTVIPTLEGWKKVGDIKEGDYLFDRNGNPTKVLKIYPQKNKKQVYKIYFKSGKTAECCDEHLWSYYNNNNNSNKLITSTVRELINNPKGLRNSKGGYNWSIPINQPVNYPEKALPIDPYVMGLILGDGCFRYQENQKAFNFSSSDIELVEQIQKRMGYKLYKKGSNKNYTWLFELKDPILHKNVWVEDILKDYPQLWNLKSEDKFIPKDFLFGSIEQRYDLLAGLMDTDGSIDEHGRVQFTTISEKLKDNIIELCESLGMTCSVSIDKRTDKYTISNCYNIHIKCSKQNKIKIFKLTRKVEKVKVYLNNGKREERRDRDPIIKIEPTDIYTDMTCFYVDNEEHLFLMNNYICTHNTRTMLGDACYLAFPYRFNIDKNCWEITGSCEKCLFFATEQELEEIQTLVLSYLTGLNEEYILQGHYNTETRVRLSQAVEIVEKYENNLIIVHMPEPTIEQVKAKVKYHYFKDGIGYLFYDYIFSNPGLLNEYRDLKIREDVVLNILSTALKNLAVELDIFVKTATQLNDGISDNNNKKIRNQSLIRGSKAIIDKADVAGIGAIVSDEELEYLKPLIESYNIIPNRVLDIYKLRRGKYTNVRIWSYVDLGTCRKTDFFVTDAKYQEIKDFEIIEYQLEYQNIQNYKSEIDNLNEQYLNKQYNIDQNGEVTEKIEPIEQDTKEQEKKAIDWSKMF